MSDPISVSQLHRPFSDLFSDALRQLDIALMKRAPAELRNSAAKASILNCALSLEAVANSLLADLEYSRRLREAADRFQPLEKFEFALYHLSEKTLDRGTAAVQAAAEIFKLRNDYVHPKVNSKQGTFSQPEQFVDFKDDGWPILKIPREPRRWVYSHAKEVVASTDIFLEYFLLELCEFDQDRATATLLPVLETQEGPRLTWVVENHKVFKMTREGKGIPLRYLNLDRQFDGFVNDTYGSKEGEIE